jgi:hypothetical protein
MLPALMITKPDLDYALETLREHLLYRNKSMITVHANYIKGNRWKMLHLLENGLWIAVPTIAVYPNGFDLASGLIKSNFTIDDKDGTRYNLEHVVLAQTSWGKCIDFVEHLS